VNDVFLQRRITVNMQLSEHTKIPPEALNKIRKYCAFRERCILEVLTRLTELHVAKELHNAALNHLREENFLNEERYARSFAGGKFRNNKWGRIRIIRELQSRNIPEECIRAGLSEIEEQEYRQTLRKLLENKIREYDEPDSRGSLYKALVYAVNKGYEPDIAREALGFS